MGVIARFGSPVARRARLGAPTEPCRRARALLGALGAAAALLVIAAPAAWPAPAWLAPQDLSAAGQNASFPQVAVDPQGHATAVWRRSNGTNMIVQAATRPAGGAWSEAQDLSAAGQNASFPQVAVDAQGHATAVWLRFNGTNEIVQAATRRAGGAWSAAEDLSAAGENAGPPQVAVDPQGNATAVWSRSNGTNEIVQAATRPAGGAWSAAQDLSAAGPTGLALQVAQVAVDPQGNATAVWSRSNGTNFIVQAATRPAGGAWSAAQDLSAAGQSAFSAQVAADAQGNATAVWSRSNGTNDIVQAATRPTGAAWSAAQDLSAAGQTARVPQVAVDPQGNATAVWRRFNGTHDVVQAATRPAGAAWSEAQDLSAAGQGAFAPQVAVDAQGNATAVWRRFNGTHNIVQAATRPTGAAWSAAQDLSAAGQSAADPQVAADPQGNALAVWSRSNGTNTIVQGAGYDAAGPQLRELQVPAAGLVGESLGFRVTPVDVWSPVTSTSWSFGDGQGAAGTEVSHAYAAAGRYEASVTATDSLGNASSATRPVEITAPPDTLAPGLSELRLAPRTFRAARSGAGLVPAAALGTRLSYRLTEAARVSFTVERARRGRRVGRRCVAERRGNRRRPACTYYARVRGSLSRPSLAGLNQLRFSGRIGGRPLGSGRYRLVAVARDAAGNRSAPRRAPFTIVRR